MKTSKLKNVKSDSNIWVMATLVRRTVLVICVLGLMKAKPTCLGQTKIEGKNHININLGRKYP